MKLICSLMFVGCLLAGCTQPKTEATSEINLIERKDRHRSVPSVRCANNLLAD